MRKENKPRWGLDDINNLIYMYRHGASIEEIAAELGRTECAVKMRLSKLRDAGHLPASEVKGNHTEAMPVPWPFAGWNEGIRRADHLYPKVVFKR